MLFEGLTYRGIVYVIKKGLKERWKNIKAIIYDIDGTLLDTLKMNMYPYKKLLKKKQEKIGLLNRF